MYVEYWTYSIYLSQTLVDSTAPESVVLTARIRVADGESLAWASKFSGPWVQQSPLTAYRIAGTGAVTDSTFISQGG